MVLRYPDGVASVLVHGTDLLMFSRIEATLRHLGHDVARTRSGVESAPADLALCDVEQVDPGDALELLRPARILGFGSHDAPQALRRARQVGFDRVVARSAIAERLPELVDELLATAPSHDPSSSGATPR
jgi:DNA-binding NarL/FixJ family response regulator